MSSDKASLTWGIGILGAFVAALLYSNWAALTETQQECKRRGLEKAARFADESRAMAKDFNNELRMFPNVSEAMLSSAYELSPGSITTASIHDPGPWMNEHVGRYFVADGTLSGVSTAAEDAENPETAPLDLSVALSSGESAHASANLLTERQRGFLYDYCFAQFECTGRFGFKAQRAQTGAYLTMELVAADIAPLDPDTIYLKSKAEDSILFTSDCGARWRR